MAKWGEGDPRWIVEERADATNVNNWHWTERDVSPWSTERLRHLLLGVRVEGPEGVCEVTDVSKLDGEASINNRKGKLFFFYEWQLRANWLGTSCGGVKFRGTVDVANLSDENDEDDLDISVSLCKDQPSTSLLDLMKRSGIKAVRKVLGEYVHQLKSEFSQGMILPSADGHKLPAPSPAEKNRINTRTQICSAPKSSHSSAPKSSHSPAPKSSHSPAPKSSHSPAPKSSHSPAPKSSHSPAPKSSHSPAPKSSHSPAPCPAGVRIPTCSFNLKETFQTSADELYRTFISQEFVQAFTRSPALVDGCRGGRFQLLDGNVSGEFTQLVPDQKIEMRWRFRSWPSEHYATIGLQLEDGGDETTLRMECRGVPAGQEDSTREGWIRFYFQAIKQTFGY